MTQSTLLLSQFQFFSGLGFLALFLVLELGLIWMLFYFRCRSLTVRGAIWTDAYRFWVRVFALAFVVRAAAIVPVLIQFGTLWPGLMEKMGDVAGPMLAALVLAVFIFQSCFVGAMLFGQRYVSDRVHVFIVLMTAVGVTAVALCLLTMYAWMNTPQGAALIEGQYQIWNWSAVVFNPAMPWFTGVFASVAAASVSFLMLGVVASQALRRPLDQSEVAVARSASVVALLGLLVAIGMLTGMGKMTAQYQPAKAAATAGYWDSERRPDIVFFAWPDEREKYNHAQLSWSEAGKKWLGRDEQGNMLGLDRFSGMAPPVAATFWGFRIAVYTGALMLAIALIAVWKLRRGTLAGCPVFSLNVLRACMFSGWLLFGAGFIHIAAGSLPYAIQDTVTYSEIAGQTPQRILIAGLVLHLAAYAIVIAGFLQLLRHIIRFGVVPVARRRGRA